MDKPKPITPGGPVHLRNPERNKAVYEDESVHEGEPDAVDTEVSAEPES